MFLIQLFAEYLSKDLVQLPFLISSKISEISKHSE